MKKLLAIVTAIALLTIGSAPSQAADAYSKKWGTFAAQTFSGTGDDVVILKTALRAGYVTMSHSGESNFAIFNLDSGNKNIDLLVNTIGAYEGTNSFGLGWNSTKTKGFEVSADGDWSIVVKPFSTAPNLPAAGEGDGVFKVYLKSRPVWKFTHSGTANFAIWQHCTSGSSDLLVNEIGSYSGKKIGSSGYCIITVIADGHWTIRK